MTSPSRDQLEKLVSYATGSLYKIDSVADHVNSIFVPILGQESVDDLPERFSRFLEESLELVQAFGMSREAAHYWVDYVYGRPVGQPPQEFAGVILTFALCIIKAKQDGILTETIGHTVVVELLRVIANKEKVAAKQLAKERKW